MKVFISWSGEPSVSIATVLYKWFPSVLQNVKPYMSAESIEKGKRWTNNIAMELDDSDFGVVCVTPENIDAPWILFESGALSKSLDKSNVSPILFNLTPSDLSNSPLMQFQQTQFELEDMTRLMLSMNSAAPENEIVSKEIVEKSTSRAWDELKLAVNNILDKKIPGHEHSRLKKLTPEQETIQEILSNTRSIIRLIGSPTEIFPADYIRSVLNQTYNAEPVVSRSHISWKEIEDGIQTFINLAEFLNKNEDFASSVDITEKHMEDIGRSIMGMRRGLRYILQKFYGPEVRVIRAGHK